MKKNKEQIFSRIRDFGAAAGDFLFPMATYCPICGNIVDRSRSYCICDHCIKRINWGHIEIDLDREALRLGREKYLDSARACMGYGLYGRRLIFELKYNGKTYVARIIGQIMSDRIKSDPTAEEISGCDYIAAVPLHPNKELKRGFNQAEKMAKYLSRGIDVPHLSRCLLRNEETAAQRSISGKERYSNLEGVFDINPKMEDMVKNKKIILVDDVYTTGATANHCAYALKQTGAREVHFIGLATGNDFSKGFFNKNP